MPASPGLESRRPLREKLAKTVRFALVGGSATVLYAVLALAFSEGLHLGAVTASIAAYAIAAIFSYVTHKTLTFRSTGAHSVAGPRFVVLTAVGFAVATVLPELMTTRAGLPATASVLTTSIVVPLINFFVLDRWVFAARRA